LPAPGKPQTTTIGTGTGVRIGTDAAEEGGMLIVERVRR